MGFITGSQIFNLQIDFSPKQALLFILFKNQWRYFQKHDVIEFMKEMDSFYICD